MINPSQTHTKTKDMKTLSCLRKLLIDRGEELPKKHGKWFRLRIWDNHWLVLDTWNGYIYHYPDGAEPSSTDNLYRCVYVFHNVKGKLSTQCKRVKKNLEKFWIAHIKCLTPQ